MPINFKFGCIHVGGEVQKNILSILLWAPALVGEQHCLVIPERLVASQEFCTSPYENYYYENYIYVAVVWTVLIINVYCPCICCSLILT